MEQYFELTTTDAGVPVLDLIGALEADNNETVAVEIFASNLAAKPEDTGDVKPESRAIITVEARFKSQCCVSDKSTQCSLSLSPRRFWIPTTTAPTGRTTTSSLPG